MIGVSGGEDTLYGNAGDDKLRGGAGNDRLIPGDGNDSSEGGAGDDQINGYLQADGSWVHWSSSGRQQASGGDGNDFIYGGSSDDLLEGDAGNDFLVGADGHDVLRGGPGNDTLRGQAGDDTLDGGDGRDYLSGGDGNDTYYVRNNHQSIYDSAGTDTVYLLADFVKVPSNIETVEVAEGVMRLPYWIDALLSDTTAGSRVLDLLGPDKTYAYAFPSALPAYDTKSKDANGWTAFNTTQQQRAQSALSYIASVVDLQFVQTPQANALNTLSFSNNTQSNTTGYAMGPSDLPGGSDLFFDNSSATPTLLRPGDVATLVFSVSAASESLSASDIVVSGGVLSDFTVSGGTYKAVITPFAGSSAPLVVGVSSSSSVEGSGTSPSSTANTLSISRAPLHPVSGTPSADRLLESPADDAVVGGEGVDTLVLSGPKADYKITYQRVSYNPELSGGFVQDTVSGRDGRDSFVGIEKLQFSDGTFDLLNPPPTEPAVYGQARSMLFDPAYYLLAQPALNKTVTVDSAFSHYLASGAALGYKPNAWFDAAYYENRWPDLQAAHLDNATLFLHYNLYGVWEGRSAGGSFDQFDGQRYLQQWPDVAAYVDANLPAFLGSRSNGAIAHYMIYGSGEGRQAYTQAGTVVSTEVVIEPGLVGVAQ